MDESFESAAARNHAQRSAAASDSQLVPVNGSRRREEAGRMHDPQIPPRYLGGYAREAFQAFDVSLGLDARSLELLSLDVGCSMPARDLSELVAGCSPKASGWRLEFLWCL